MRSNSREIIVWFAAFTPERSMEISYVENCRMRQLVQQCTKFGLLLRSFQRLQAAISDEGFVIQGYFHFGSLQASVLSQQLSRFPRLLSLTLNFRFAATLAILACKVYYSVPCGSDDRIILIEYFLKKTKELLE